MAQYKVPQDVEAEDKLLGPFTFRQFIYLLIAAAGIAGAWGLFQIFPLLALIPLPFIFFFGILALPVRKDQPMETYLAALVGFYLKPNRRVWTPGQRESTIKIIAPKKVEKSRTRDITEDEASHRLSFLANIVDTEGYAIRGEESTMKDEYAAEADTIKDVLEADNPVIDRIIAAEQTNRKQELVRGMRTAMQRTDELVGTPAQTYTPTQAVYAQPAPQPIQIQQPQPAPQPVPQPVQSVQQLTQASLNQAAVNQKLTNLANNNTFSIQTIAQQANRIQQQAQPQQPVQPVPQQIQPPIPQPQPIQQPIQQQPNPFNNMMPPTVAGTPPVFQPMSVPLPDLPEPGHRYNQSPDTIKRENDRPDLYGPQAAIFSS
ncbi:MAG: PrgI family protein [Candidatus Saccharibacteria bacterium]|nr:PrgI family protein [Candidatus Saccharibacteria bacterium]